MSDLFPVMEIYGPTIQGEGPEIGAPCHFIRFGGCDYRCSWCDSLHAVLPNLVRENAEFLTAKEIATRVRALPGDPDWVILTGGNPLLQDLMPVINELEGYKIAVETQGTHHKPWLDYCDRVVVSPKPPSSQMPYNEKVLDEFLHQSPMSRTVIKIVILTEEDLIFAKFVHRDFPTYPLYLSVCNEWYKSDDPGTLLDRWRWVQSSCATDPVLSQAFIHPQLHVLAWGNEKLR